MQLDPLGQLHPVVIGATVAIVALLYVVLRRWLFTPYVAVLDERQMRIDEGRERLAEAEAVSQQSVWDVASIESEARSKAEAIQHEALEEAEAYRKRTMDQAIRDVDGMLAQGARGDRQGPRAGDGTRALGGRVVRGSRVRPALRRGRPTDRRVLGGPRDRPTGLR